jgi:hypothetical protein
MHSHKQQAVICKVGFKSDKRQILGAEWSVLLIQYRAGDKIEKIEMGGACSTYGGRERCVQISGGEA